MNKIYYLRCGKKRVCKTLIHKIKDATITIPNVCKRCDTLYIKELLRGMNSLVKID